MPTDNGLLILAKRAMIKTVNTECLDPSVNCDTCRVRSKCHCLLIKETLGRIDSGSRMISHERFEALKKFALVD